MHYGMSCLIKYKIPFHLMHLKVISISSLDGDSPYILWHSYSLFYIFHISSQLIWYHCNFYVLFIYLCISSSNIFVFNSQHCAHWYALVIALLYNIAMILLNSCSLYHVDVKAVLLHAYCTYAMVLRTRCQWRVELFQSDWLYHV